MCHRSPGSTPTVEQGAGCGRWGSDPQTKKEALSSESPRRYSAVPSRSRSPNTCTCRPSRLCPRPVLLCNWRLARAVKVYKGLHLILRSLATNQTCRNESYFLATKLVSPSSRVLSYWRERNAYRALGWLGYLMLQSCTESFIRCVFCIKSNSHELYFFKHVFVWRRSSPRARSPVDFQPELQLAVAISIFEKLRTGNNSSGEEMPRFQGLVIIDSEKVSRKS